MPRTIATLVAWLQALFAAVGAAPQQRPAATPQDIPIIKQESTINDDGSFQWS